MQVFGNRRFGVVQLAARIAQLAFGIADLAAGIGQLYFFILQGGPAVLDLGAGGGQLLLAVLVLGQAVIILLPAVVQLSLGGGQFGGVGLKFGTACGQLRRAFFVLQQAQAVLGQLPHACDKLVEIGLAVIRQGRPPVFDCGSQGIADRFGQFVRRIVYPVKRCLQGCAHGGGVGGIGHGGNVVLGFLQALLLLFR